MTGQGSLDGFTSRGNIAAEIVSQIGVAQIAPLVGGNGEALYRSGTTLLSTGCDRIPSVFCSAEVSGTRRVAAVPSTAGLLRALAFRGRALTRSSGPTIPF